ncbi:MAG: NADPH-dependent oxidoreductase [Planctomycetota bacterium]
MNPPIDLMLNHRSIRHFEDQPIPHEHIQRAVEAGQAASTSSAVQAYSVMQITNPDTRERIAQLTGPQEKVARSGAFFIVCGDVRRHRLLAERIDKSYDAETEAFLVAVIDATLFAQNFTLAFEAMGYGICYIGGVRNDLYAVDELLDLPDGVYPLYGLCVGVPAEDPSPRPRLPVEAILYTDAYPDDEEILAQVDAYDAQYIEYLRERGADPVGWSERVAAKAAAAVRSDVGDYYRSKGAEL